LKIIEFPNNDDYRYVVYIEGKEHIIKDKTEKTRNTEIIDLVKDHIVELNEGQDEYVSSVVDSLRKIYKIRNPFAPLGVKNETYIKQQLSKYFEGDMEQDEKGVTRVNYKWTMHDGWAQYGILVFQKDDIIDVVVLSDKNLD